MNCKFCGKEVFPVDKFKDWKKIPDVYHFECVRKEVQEVRVKPPHGEKGTR